MAVVCGVAVANLYYAQPLLPMLSEGFSTGSGAAALVVTASQVGYAIGLVLLVPLGDMVDRRRLVSVLLALAAVGLAGCALSPSLAWLEVFSVAVGVASIVAQVLIPMAADLAPEGRRGRTVGFVMGGLLIGVLTGRSLAGVVAQVGGWRSVYWVAAALVTVASVLMALVLPRGTKGEVTTYRRILVSTVRIFLDTPLVRRRCMYGAVGFAAFSVLWTTVAFLLAAPPYRYPQGVIGLFGLGGVAGALVAGWAGRLSDAGRSGLATGLFAFLILASWGISLSGSSSLAGVIGGIVVLDLGVQGLQITNQTIIYGALPSARSRITSVYMASYFAGGAAGSLGGGAAYSLGGWPAACALGASLGGVAVVLWLLESARSFPKSHLRGSK